MKQHLAYLRVYKDILRLKLNSSEDLLVNGRREPTDRGVCRHLLGKLDATVIEQAVAREPLHSDAAARARMLAGAIRVTADVGVLLTYLETLGHVRSHAEAAQAFAEVVRRIDFESLSAARLGRLLQVLIATFTDHERVQVLFSLLAAPAFSRAFDAAAEQLPPDVHTAFAPLRAVHRHVLRDRSAAASPAVLATGLEQVLGAPDPVLRGYAEPIRTGMLELALGPTVPAALADRAAGVLLPTLPRTGRVYARLAMRRASQLLARHADDRAKAVLTDLHQAQPGQRTAERWLRAIAARRLGRVALGSELPARGRLAMAFWLDGQCDVWIRTAPASDGGRLATEAEVQAALRLPGVAPVVEHGAAHGSAYVAIAGAGRPLAPEPMRSMPGALAVVAAATRILRAVALAGAALPDAAPGRFLHDPQGGGLTLADLDGATATDRSEAEGRHAGLAKSLAKALIPAEHLPVDIAEALAQASDLSALIDALDRAMFRAPHEPA